jgi:hypothetical protein
LPVNCTKKEATKTKEGKMKVRVGRVYEYRPVLLDMIDPKSPLKSGEKCRVVNLPGCPKAPKANTMGHCHVENLKGEFLGLVSCNSLTPAF